VGGAILSTIAWLFTGHLSWFIDNRTYPESKVLMSVRIRRPDDGPRAGEAEAAATAESKRPLFQDPLPLKGLALPFVERAEPANWFLNIVVPPWWGDASPEAAGGSLAEKSMDFFAEQAPTRIAERLPAAYFGEAQTYLIFDRAGNRLLIASQQALRRLTISSTSGRGSRRTLTQEKLETYWAQGEEARAMRNSILATGILAPDEDDRYYSVPLLKREREFVRVEGELANQASTGPYTVFVEP
jgi:hypothetical protein